MLNIGKKIDSVRYRGEGSTIKGVVEGLRYNKLVIFSSGVGCELDVDNVDEIKQVGVAAFERWRVIGMGLLCSEITAVGEDPVIEFGRRGDPNAYGTVTFTAGGAEKFNLDDFLVYDYSDILPPEHIDETSATCKVTWASGTEFNVWQSVVYNLEVAEAAAGAIGAGKFRPILIIEVDTGGKY